MSVWGKNKGASAAAAATNELDVTMKRQAAKLGQEWNDFWSGWVYFEDGDEYQRHVWMHNFMSTIVQIHSKHGYMFAFNLVSMKRKCMLWLFELEKAVQEGREPIVPPVHARHRNNPDDFTEYDYVFEFSDFWRKFVGDWATVDMLDRYDDKLAALLPLFLYAHIDTERSNKIVAADELRAQVDRAIAEEEEERGVRRPDDRRRDDMYYQEAGYYKGNREYG
jgi:hypothetical protein